MGWPRSQESFRIGNAQQDARNQLVETGASIKGQVAIDKNGNEREYTIKQYEATFANSTDYDLYIEHGLDVTVDDFVFVDCVIVGYNQNHPPSSSANAPDGIVREWGQSTSWGINNYAPSAVAVSDKYLHVRRVEPPGTPSIRVTAKITVGYFTE